MVNTLDRYHRTRRVTNWSPAAVRFSGEAVVIAFPTLGIFVYLEFIRTQSYQKPRNLWVSKKKLGEQK